MTDLSTDNFWEDSFSRADSTSLGGNWSNTGDVQIINNAARQSSSALAAATMTVAATTVATRVGSDYALTAKVSCDDDNPQRTGRLMFRYSDGDKDGYLVGLKWDSSSGSQVLTLEILKSVAGTVTVLTSADVTVEANLVSASNINVIQLLGGGVYDSVDGVVIEAFFNNEQRPRLTWTDQQYPQFKESGNVGFIFGDADAGVNGHVFVQNIRMVALLDDDEGFAVVPRKYNAAYLRDQVKSRALKDSSSNFDDESFMQSLNEANQELHADLVNAPWLIELYTFQMVSGDTFYELPGNTITLDEIIYDVGNQNPLQILDLQQWRRLGFTDTVGQPELFYIIGQGRSGGIKVRPYPRPNDGGTFECVRYKSPAILSNDDDIPELPEVLCPALIWGALYYYTFLKSSRQHANMAAVNWENWKRRVKRYVHRGGTLAQHSHVQHSFRNRAGRRTAVQNARYGIRR